MTLIAVIFWISIATIVYAFAGYPLLLVIAGIVRRREWQKGDSTPFISVVIAAHNESGSIVKRISNLLGSDYPADKIEILAGSDGSTDDTVENLRAITDPRVHVFAFSERRGKPTILNTLIPEARAPIVVLADARQTFDAHALRALVQPFDDPAIGAVTGELVLRPSATAVVAAGSGVYWRYETFIRSRESALDSTLITGAICAIRKELFDPIPADTFADDLLMAVRIWRRGYRVVLQREARAYDTTPARSSQEFARKVRTLAGVFQLFARERWLLNPFRNRLWWQIVSHKAARLLVPLCQASAFVCNAMLAAHSMPFRLLLAGQILFYASALAGVLTPAGTKRPAAIACPYIFCLLNWATVLAFFRWITRRQTVTWEKTAVLT